MKINKSLFWFKKTHLDLQKIVQDTGAALRTISLFYSNVVSKEIIEEQTLLSAKIRHKKLEKPNGLLSKFLNKDTERWEAEIEQLHSKLANNVMTYLNSETVKTFLKKHPSVFSQDRVQNWFDGARDTERLTIQGLIDDFRKSFSREQERAAKDLELIKPKLNALEIKEDKKQRDAAVLASAKNKSRANAEKIKRKLEISEKCPYCMGVIGNDPEADHIYPLSRGGQETEKNMVYVCSFCNREKSDKTLAIFCEEKGFDEARIRKALTKMGKEY